MGEAPELRNFYVAAGLNSSGIAADIMQQFETALRGELGVTVNRQVIESLF